MTAMMEANTIVAVATPEQGAILGIVRLSGPETMGIAGQLFLPRDGKQALESVRWGALKGHVVLGRSGLTLPATCLIMKAPRSYTGEDVCELHVPGSLVLQDMIVELAVRFGARPATAGEFSCRAFQNDRMDLSQMESVALLVNAETESERRAALKGLGGALGSRINELARAVIALLTPLELSIDFSDQDIEIIDSTNAAAELSRLLSDVDEMLQTRAAAPRARGALRVVLLGAANVGKSTLFNALLGHDAALTGEEVGTTRDYLEGDLTLGEFKLRLVDTAGVQSHADRIEEAAAVKSQSEAWAADLRLYVARGNEPFLSSVESGAPTLSLRTFADTVPHSERLGDGLRNELWVSGVSHEGIHELKEAIVARLQRGDYARSGALLLNQRHVDALTLCREALERGLSGFVDDQGRELVAADLREALHALEAITGADHDAAVLDGILRDFCIGK